MNTRTREAQVAALCTQYAAYNSTTDLHEQQRIGDSMFFDDPLIWMMYKCSAYAGTAHEISTWGALCTHSLDHDGICGKRLHFLRSEVRRIHGVDILSTDTFPLHTPLREVIASPLLESVSCDDAMLHAWRSYEYESDNEGVHKWRSYAVRTDDGQENMTCLPPCGHHRSAVQEG